ncbi:uncharacterized protein CEXT_807601 [Caerostris extrusa]|uniref:Uncharacterized protein n=1 Tax=Caerostris extrusa TaxID=172846 RepID=A0AAV4VXJ1_CAEEX|nr:uncharacterized protein CEXT_807601 [Caerostris extrusa]
MRNGVTEEDVQKAIKDMHRIYQGSPDSLSKNSSCLADFNKVAYRCAYLHKYAAFHAALAYETMSRALTENSVALTLDSFHLFRSPLKICSLGGVVVDIMAEWKSTLSSVIQELRLGKGNYGTLSQSVSDELFRCSFLAADIQSKMSGLLNKAIGSADLITMVKFVSATASTKTSDMIEKIFRVIKPGALVLFVDNAAGGFQQLISNAAAKYAFIPVFGSLNHELYVNETFNQIKFVQQLECEKGNLKKTWIECDNSAETKISRPLSLDENTLPTNSLPAQQLECEKGNIKKTLIEFDNSTETVISKPLSLDENILSTNSLSVQQLECEKGNIKKTLIEFDNSAETEISKSLSLDENTLSTNSLPVQQLECEKGNTKKTLIEFDNSTETEIAKPLSLDENTLPKIQLQSAKENGKKPLLELDDSELKRKSVKRKALLPEPLSNSPLYFKRKRQRLNLSYEDQMSPDASLISPNRFFWNRPLCNSSQFYEDSFESLNTYFNNSNQFFYDMPPRNSPQRFEFSPYHTRPRMLFNTPNQWSPYLPFTNIPSHQNQSFNSEKCNLCGCVHLGLCY